MNKHSVVVDPAVKQNCLADLSLGPFIASISLNVYHVYIPYETVSYRLQVMRNNSYLFPIVFSHSKTVERTDIRFDL